MAKVKQRANTRNPAQRPRSAEESFRNRSPLLLERTAALGFARPLIPVRSIPRIAFLAVQVCVHSGASRTLVLLRRFASSRPVPFSLPPQPGQGLTGRLILRYRLRKLLQIH